jgi:hypothetical protein
LCRLIIGSLTVEFTSTSDASNQYVLELEGAKFMNGRCDGKRVENDASKQMVDVPRAAGTLKVRAAWSGTDMTVRLSLQSLGFCLRSKSSSMINVSPPIQRH